MDSPLHMDPESLGKARVQNVRQRIRDFGQNDRESVNNFRGKFKESDKEGAFDVLEDSTLKEV